MASRYLIRELRGLLTSSEVTCVNIYFGSDHSLKHNSSSPIDHNRIVGEGRKKELEIVNVIRPGPASWMSLRDT